MIYMKRLVKSIISLCFALVFFTLAASCSTEKINVPCVLTDLYLDGILSENDIKNVAAHRVGYVAIVSSKEQETEDYRKQDFEKTSFAPLTDEQKASVKADYEERRGKVSEFEVTGYYGNYNGRYVVEVYRKSEGEEVVTSVEKLIVASVYLGFIGASHEIYVWQPVA